MDLSLLKTLCETPGVSGREERVRDVVLRASEGLFDSITTDVLGNVVARKKPRGKSRGRVIVSCHMDEIGFFIRHIDDRGFCRIVNAGGFDTRNLLARRVRVQSSSGQDLLGVMNPVGRPLHISRDEERKKVPEIGDFVIDLFLPPEEVKKKVRVGDPVTLVQDFTEIGPVVTGKALDNRVASFVAIEAMRKVRSLRYELIVAHTVQEEVGLRGAVGAAYSSEADVGLALDVMLAVDTPGVPDDEAVSRFGEGAALLLMDSASMASRSLVEEFEARARTGLIPYQLSILPRGATESAALQRARGGMRTMTLCVPCRNVHTVTEACHKRDIQATIDLLAAWLSS